MPGTLSLQTLQNTIIQAGRGRKKRRSMLARAHISQSGRTNGIRWERVRKNETPTKGICFFNQATHAYRSWHRLLVMHDRSYRLRYEFALRLSSWKQLSAAIACSISAETPSYIEIV